MGLWGAFRNHIILIYFVISDAQMLNDFHVVKKEDPWVVWTTVLPGEAHVNVFKGEFDSSEQRPQFLVTGS